MGLLRNLQKIAMVRRKEGFVDEMRAVTKVCKRYQLK